MSKLSHALAMLALSSLGAAATQADAAIALGSTTVTLDLAGLDPTGVPVGQTDFNLTPITLGGKSAPQFYFVTEGLSAVDSTSGVVSHVAIDVLVTAQSVSATPNFGMDQSGAMIVNPYAGSAYQSSGIGVKSATPGLPTHGETFTRSASATGLYKSPYTVDGQDQSGQQLPSPLYLHVNFDPAGKTYVGSFKTSADGGLASITFNAVPEPEAWALLVVGAGITGAALRSRRRGLIVT